MRNTPRKERLTRAESEIAPRSSGEAIDVPRALFVYEGTASSTVQNLDQECQNRLN